MDRTREIAEALLEVVSENVQAHEDIGPDVEDHDLGVTYDALPPNAVATSQVWTIIRIDDVPYAVVAYRIAE